MTMKWKHLVWFFALSILLLALVPLLHLTTGASMDFDAVGAKASEETGLTWTSNLLVVIRLCFAEPSLWLMVLGSAVPALAGLIVAFRVSRETAVAVFKRINPIGKGTELRTALGAYGTIMVTIPVFLLIVFALRSILPGHEYTRPENLFGPGLLIALLVAAFLDQGGVLEELGWRGYAQPELQKKLLSPLMAAVVIGLAWGMWHIPRDVFIGLIGRLGFVQYLFLYLPSFILGTVTTSIIIGYFMNRTGGSLIPAIMIHGLGNDAIGLSGPAAMDIALTPAHQITKALPFLVYAVILIAFSGKELGRSAIVEE